MNRRSVLRWLGLAPAAAPAAMAAASAPPLPPIDYSGLASDIGGRLGLSTFSFDAQTGVMTIQAQKFSLVNERFESAITSEKRARVCADAALASRIDGQISRLG